MYLKFSVAHEHEHLECYVSMFTSWQLGTCTWKNIKDNDFCGGRNWCASCEV